MVQGDLERLVQEVCSLELPELQRLLREAERGRLNLLGAGKDEASLASLAAAAPAAHPRAPCAYASHLRCLLRLLRGREGGLRAPDPALRQEGYRGVCALRASSPHPAAVATAAVEGSQLLRECAHAGGAGGAAPAAPAALQAARQARQRGGGLAVPGQPAAGLLHSFWVVESLPSYVQWRLLA